MRNAGVDGCHAELSQVTRSNSKDEHRKGALPTARTLPGTPTRAEKAGRQADAHPLRGGLHVHPPPPRRAALREPLNPVEAGGRRLGAEPQTDPGAGQGRDESLHQSPACGWPITERVRVMGSPCPRQDRGAGSPGKAPSRTHKRLEVPRQQKQGHMGPEPELSLCGRAPGRGMAVPATFRGPYVQAEETGRQSLTFAERRRPVHTSQQRATAIIWESSPALPDGVVLDLTQKGTFRSHATGGNDTPARPYRNSAHREASAAGPQSPRTRASELLAEGQDHPRERMAPCQLWHTQLPPQTPHSALVRTLGAGSANSWEKSAPWSSGRTRTSREADGELNWVQR